MPLSVQQLSWQIWRRPTKKYVHSPLLVEGSAQQHIVPQRGILRGGNQWMHGGGQRECLPAPKCITMQLRCNICRPLHGEAQLGLASIGIAGLLALSLPGSSGPAPDIPATRCLCHSVGQPPNTAELALSPGSRDPGPCTPPAPEQSLCRPGQAFLPGGPPIASSCRIQLSRPRSPGNPGGLQWVTGQTKGRLGQV